MKIGFIGHKRIPGREGGIEVVVEELSTRMADLGHDIVVYNRKKKNTKAIKSYKNVKIITIPTIEQKNLDAFIYSFLASIHAIFCNYDVIHYHALGPSVMLFIPHIFGIKTVVTVHGLNYKTPKWNGFGKKYIKFGEKITAKFADEIIVLSKEQKEYFLEKYNRKTLYIPNGVTIKNTLPAKLIYKKWGLVKNNYILFLSRIVPGKGLEHLIKAYRQIKTDIPLIIAGNSSYVNDFYKYITELVSKDSRIKMIGFVNGQYLDELYSNAKIFVFPSEAEGMPMCLLEALSFNTLCLVSDIPENLEICKEYVHSFHVGDINDLRKKLENMLNCNGSISKNSRKYISDTYNWDIVTQDTIKCYKGEL